MNIGDRQIDCVNPQHPDSSRVERDGYSTDFGFRGRLRLYGPLLFLLVVGGAMLNRPVEPENIREEGFILDYANLGMVTSPDSTPEAISPEDLERLGIIRQRMIEQLRSGVPSKFRSTDSMTWTVMIPDVSVHSIEIIDSNGIVRTDFPDRVTGREDLTGGPGTGSTIKGWNWGETYTLPKPPALGIQKLESGEEVYWLMYPTSVGGWRDLPQPHIEAARIFSYDSRRDPREIRRAKLFDKEGEEVSVGRLSLKPLTQFTVAKSK